MDMITVVFLITFVLFCVIELITCICMFISTSHTANKTKTYNLIIGIINLMLFIVLCVFSAYYAFTNKEILVTSFSGTKDKTPTPEFTRFPKSGIAVFDLRLLQLAQAKEKVLNPTDNFLEYKYDEETKVYFVCDDITNKNNLDPTKRKFPIKVELIIWEKSLCVTAYNDENEKKALINYFLRRRQAIKDKQKESEFAKKMERETTFGVNHFPEPLKNNELKKFFEI